MNESNIKGVSVRSILAFVIVITVCVVAFLKQDLATLKDLAFLVLGFYFGQKPTVPTNTTTTVASTTVSTPEASNAKPTV